MRGGTSGVGGLGQARAVGDGAGWAGEGCAGAGWRGESGEAGADPGCGDREDLHPDRDEVRRQGSPAGIREVDMARAINVPIKTTLRRKGRPSAIEDVTRSTRPGRAPVTADTGSPTTTSTASSRWTTNSLEPRPPPILLANAPAPSHRQATWAGLIAELDRSSTPTIRRSTSRPPGRPVQGRPGHQSQVRRRRDSRRWTPARTPRQDARSEPARRGRPVPVGARQHGRQLHPGSRCARWRRRYGGHGDRPVGRVRRRGQHLVAATWPRWPGRWPW